MSDIDSLIKRAQTVMSEPHGSTKYEIWKHDAHNFAEQNYGADLLRIFDNALRPKQILRHGDDLQAFRNERIGSALDFLSELKGRDAENDLVSSGGQKFDDAKKSVQDRFSRSNIVVNGNATFGDNGPLNQIEIGEFMASLTSEVEALPETPEKQTLLQQLKAVTENETFAAIAGAAVSSVIQGLVK